MPIERALSQLLKHAPLVVVDIASGGRLNRLSPDGYFGQF